MAAACGLSMALACSQEVPMALASSSEARRRSLCRVVAMDRLNASTKASRPRMLPVTTPIPSSGFSFCPAR